MNKNRRKSLEELQLRIIDIKDSIEYIFNEEEDYKANIPENLLTSKRYTESDNACENLQDCVSNLSSAIENIDLAIG